MQAGRELDFKVAKALGWKVSEDEGIFCDEDGHVLDEPKFSTTWEGMGVLVEEARKQDWWLHIQQTGDVWYAANFWNCKTCEHSLTVHETAMPLAVCVAFLEMKGVSI